MEEAQSWRELLSNVIRDPQEKHRIARELGITPITLSRWTENLSTPRPDNLRPLLEALPQHRQLLKELILKEFPKFFSESLLDQTIPEIPSTFYARVFNANATSPAQLRYSTIRTLILQQMLAHLDPRKQGTSIVIVQCIPPGEGGKVRSLRKTCDRGTNPWEAQMDQWTLYVGAESQTGHAVMSGHLTILQNRAERLCWFPAHHSEFEASVAAYPILRADLVAGSICILSTQENFFTQERRDLIQSYTDLMVLAFDAREFYHLRDIELGIMPDYYKQHPQISTFHQRVTQHMIQASKNNQHFTRSDAEALVWKEIEEELLQTV